MRFIFFRSNRRFLFTAILSLYLFFPLLAQQSYESGYLVERSGQRREVSILNEDWRFNPDEILVRERPDAEAVAIRTQTLREFGIEGKAKYVNVRVAIEKSSTELGNLSPTPPVSQTERVLLRVEVEGKASLYSYLAPRLSKFFLSKDGLTPRQLIFTRTQVAVGQISESRTFVQQLRRHLPCADHDLIKDHIHYSLKDLKKAVIAYNDCAAGGSTDILDNTVAGNKPFLVSVLAGAHYARMRIGAGRGQPETATFQRGISARVGVDLEFFPAFGGNKFAAVFRPSYYRTDYTGTLSIDNAESPITAIYDALDLSFGLRYYSFLNTRLKIFGTASLGLTTPFGEIRSRRGVIAMESMNSACVELGTHVADRWNLSIAYERVSYILSGPRTSGYRVLVGYTL